MVAVAHQLLVLSLWSFGAKYVIENEENDDNPKLQ
jgi:hypothetical protein